jgi:predicted P-loop ATPase
MDSFTTLGDMVRPVQPCSQDAHNTSVGAGSAGLKPSGKGNPCPICSRTKDGDCRIGAELVLCHYGSSHHPPEGLRPGDTHPGGDGQQWAYTKDTSDGRAATFVIDRPLQAVGAPPRRIEVAQLPEAWPEPPSHLPNGQRLKYSATQAAVVVVAGNSKKHIPYHTNASGKEVRGAGAEPWPLWRQADAIEYGAGKWIIETEGEKCAAWPRAAGLVAVSQPGHDTKEDSITGRYKALRAAGVAGVAYLADNDKTGAAKGAKCQRAAAAAGLPFLLLQSAEVWPGVCVGGSIDDAPGSAQDRAQVLQKAIQKAATTKTTKTVNSRSKPTITSTGIQAVLDARGSGWRPQKEGPPIRSKMAIGDLSGRLTSELGNRLGFDEVALMPAVDRVPLKDWEVSLLHGELSEAGWIIGSEAAEAGLLLAARRNPFHPVREYLKRVEADPAIAAFDLDQVAPRFFRAASALHKMMVRKWLIGAVARAMDPGCQMDYCLVLQSDIQGIGKTSELRELASPEWFTSTIPDQDKDWTLNVHCCWIFELAELESLTGAKAAGKIKNMLTTTTDLVRVPYGKVPERMKRPSVFCATVNKRVFLRDDTGNRRFWVVPIEGTEKLDRAGLAAARDGIWKAAVLAYRKGEKPMLPDGLADASEQQNDDFRERDVWMPLLTKYLSRRQQEQHIPVQAGEFLEHIGMASERQNTHHGKRVRELAESLGWRHQQRRAKGGERKLGLWPGVATSATSATGVATGLNASEASASNGVATSATSKSEDQSLKTKKQEQQEQQEQPSGDLCSFFEVAEVATRPNASDASASGPVATHLPPTCRGCHPVATPDSEPEWHQKARLLRDANPDMAYNTVALHLDIDYGEKVTGRQVREVLEQDDPRAA